MSADEEPLDALVRSVSDDRPVDWDAAESDAGARGEDASVSALRDIALVAEFNRGLQRAAAGAEGDAMPPHEAPRWGQLLLLETIGAGRQGEVWRCWDPRLRREVALKWLVRAADEAPAGGEPELVAEARALARVSDPGVVTVHGIAEHDGRTGMWMELLRGETLADAIARRGPLPAAEVAEIGRRLAGALHAVHAAGLVHRDVKPANVVLEPSGRVVLTDFGLGQRRDLPEAPLARLSGTPMFMSPERLAGGVSSPSSDLYALGATLWNALAGRPPFAARSLDALREEVARGPARPLSAECPGAPRALVAAIERALAPTPQARFASAQALATALESPAVAAAPHRHVGPRRLLLAVGALAVLAAAAAALALRPHVQRPAAVAAAAPGPAYEVEAALVRRTHGRYEHLADGDRVAPGDRLSLEFRASRPAWVYVLDEDEQGESYLLFPGPAYDRRNPIDAGPATTLPGTVGGRENGWTVTSRGGREHFLVVASPAPVPALEAELARVPPATPGRPVRDAPLAAAAVEQLRGVGGVAPLTGGAAPRRAGTLARVARLAGRETGVRGTWVREVTLENPLR